MVAIDCSQLSCIPIEYYLGVIGISIAIAVLGLMRQPQIPAMITFGGMFIMTIAVMFNGIILGAIPDSSTVSGSTTNYNMEDNGFDATGLPQVMVALIGAVMMLTGAIMVNKS